MVSDIKIYQGRTWVKWLRMQGHHLTPTPEVTGSNPGPGNVKNSIIEKNPRDS